LLEAFSKPIRLRKFEADSSLIVYKIEADPPFEIRKKQAMSFPEYVSKKFPASEKSTDPDAVPDKIKIVTAGIGRELAIAAKQNGRTLSEEIRARLIASLEADRDKSSQ
jgi:hypothetical protein